MASEHKETTAASTNTAQTAKRPKRVYGMHDQKSSRNPEELRQALKVELKTERDTYKPGDKVKAEIRVTNIGAGHRVPTG